MNLLLFDPAAVADDGTVSADGRQLRHLNDVLRASPGATLRAGVIGGPRGTATVVRCDESGADLSLDLSEAPSPQPPVDLVLAIPRPKVGRRVLEAAATLGVGHIDLVNAWRVDKSYLDSPAYQSDAIRQQLVLGCEQGQTTWLPTFALHRRLMAFFDEDDHRTSGARKLVAHPGADLDLRRATQARTDDQRVVIAIGPEGGWIERELETFVARGYELVWLSDRTLRVEHAVVTALGQLELLRRARLGLA